MIKRHLHSRLTIAALLLFALSGCQQGLGTIYRTTTLNPSGGDGVSLVTDARQRAVLNLDVSDASLPGSTDPIRIVCSEPSPDVATSVGAAFGTGVSVMQYGSGSLSAAQSEALLQLTERTAAIQDLRDQMYQVCLAYANGAISGTVYSLHMSRLNDTLVTLVLGETAGGAFGRPLRAIGASGESQAEAAQPSLPGEAGAASGGTGQPAPADQGSTQAADTASSTASSKTTTQLDQVTAGITAKVDASVANSIRDMQSNFLNDDFSDSFIAACMTELGRYYLDKDGNTLLGAPNNPNGVINAANTELLKLSADNEPAARALTMRGVPTGLSYLCNESLVSVAQRSFDNHHIESLKKIEVEMTEAQTRYLEEFQKAISACKGLADEAQKKACQAKVIGMQEAAAAP